VTCPKKRQEIQLFQVRNDGVETIAGQARIEGESKNHPTKTKNVVMGMNVAPGRIDERSPSNFCRQDNKGFLPIVSST
jgi:hypothetical protein